MQKKFGLIISVGFQKSCRYVSLSQRLVEVERKGQAKIKYYNILIAMNVGSPRIIVFF